MLDVVVETFLENPLRSCSHQVREKGRVFLELDKPCTVGTRLCIHLQQNMYYQRFRDYSNATDLVWLGAYPEVTSNVEISSTIIAVNHPDSLYLRWIGLKGWRLPCLLIPDSLRGQMNHGPTHHRHHRHAHHRPDHLSSLVSRAW